MLRRTYYAIQILGGSAGALLFIAAWPYTLLNAVCLLIPVVSLALYAFYSPQWHAMSQKKRDNLVTYTWFLPSLSLAMRALVDYRALNWDRLLFPALGLAGALLTLFFIVNAGESKKFGWISALCLCLAVYAPAAVLQVNYLTARAVQVRPATILSLTHRSARMWVRHWAKLETEEGVYSVAMNRSDYRRLTEGSAAECLIIEGGLGIRLLKFFPAEGMDGE